MARKYRNRDTGAMIVWEGPNRPTKSQLDAAFAQQHVESRKIVAESGEAAYPKTFMEKAGEVAGKVMEPFSVLDPTQYRPVESFKHMVKSAPGMITGEGPGEYPRLRAGVETAKGALGTVGLPLAALGTAASGGIALPIIGMSGQLNEIAREKLTELGAPSEISEAGGMATGLLSGLGIGGLAAKAVRPPSIAPGAPNAPQMRPQARLPGSQVIDAEFTDIPPVRLPPPRPPGPTMQPALPGPIPQPGPVQPRLTGSVPVPQTAPLVPGTTPLQLQPPRPMAPGAMVPPPQIPPVRLPSGAIPLGGAVGSTRALPPPLPQLPQPPAMGGENLPAVQGPRSVEPYEPPRPMLPDEMSEDVPFRQRSDEVGEYDPVNRSEAEQLPDTVKLYRGEYRGDPRAIPDWVKQGIEENGSLDAEGRWFTDDLEIAKWYQQEAGPGGAISAVTVPRGVAEQAHVTNQPALIQRFSLNPEREYFLPRDIAETRQVESIQAPPPEPVQSALPPNVRAAQEYGTFLDKVGSNPGDRLSSEMAIARGQAMGRDPAQIAQDLSSRGVHPGIVKGLVEKVFNRPPDELPSDFKFPDDRPRGSPQTREIQRKLSPEGQDITEGPKIRNFPKGRRGEAGFLSFGGRHTSTEMSVPTGIVSKFAKRMEGLVSSTDQFLSKNPHTKPIVDAVRNFYTEEQNFNVDLFDRYVASTKNLSRTSKQNVWEILNGTATTASPAETAAATQVRGILDYIFNESVAGGVKTRRGQTPRYLKDYVSHIVHNPDAVETARAFMEGVFKGGKSFDAVKKRLFGTEESSVRPGYGDELNEPRGTPRTPFVEKRKGTDLPLEKDLDIVMRRVIESYGRAIHRGQALREGRQILDKLPDSVDKSFAEWYLEQYSGLQRGPLARLYQIIRQVDRPVARMGARSQLGLSGRLQTLHAARVLMMGWPELGTRATLEGLVNTIGDFKGAHERARVAGLLPQATVPRQMKTGMEVVDNVMNFADVGNTLAKLIIHEGNRAKLQGKPDWEQLAVNETKRMEGVVDPTTVVPMMQYLPKFVLQYKYWLQKYGENATRALVSSLKEPNVENLMRVGRYALAAAALMELTEKTGVALWHIHGRSMLELGSTAYSATQRVAADLAKGDFESAAKRMLKFATPAGQVLEEGEITAMEREQGGRSRSRSNRRSR